MRRSYCSSVFLAAVLIGTASPTLAQEDFDWGHVPDADLALTTYVPDTNAVAVVLGDEGHVRFRRNLDVVFERHRRLKVFAPAGYDYATVEIAYRPSSQKLKGIEGQTFVVGDDGRVRKVELDRGSIFEERLDDDWRRVRFTLPALEPGAVFEYRYTLESDTPVLFPSWTFQGTVPTRWSAFHAEIPRYLKYVRFVQGNPAFAVEEIEENPYEPEKLEREIAFNRDPRGSSRRLLAKDRSSEQTRFESHTNDHRWVAREVPALSEEPYITTMDDYFQRIEFQLAAYLDKFKIPQLFFESWDKLAEEVREHEGLGRHLRPTRAVRERVATLALDSLSASGRATAIYDHVRKGIVWDETFRAFADRDLDEVLNQSRGSSAEVNLLLIALLRAAEMEAFPLLISTRVHGQVLRAYPKYSQFNHVLAVVIADERIFLLDATDRLRPAGMLPIEALSGSGWLVTDDAQQWVGVQATTEAGKTVFVDGALDADGTLTGTILVRLAGYAALDARRAMEEGEAPLKAAFEQAPTTVTVSEVEINGAEEDGPLTIRSAFAAPGQGQAVAHLLTVDPMLLGGFDENPLRRPERTYPVDFAYPFTSAYNADISLPEGYLVDELPEPVAVSLLDGAAQYRHAMEMKDGKLRIQRQLTVETVTYEPEVYDALRTFFADVVAGDAGVVVLVRAE